MADYDYIVIGAGSAGCVVANRLSEDPHVSVLLLEAGDADNMPAIHQPALWGTLLNSAIDWSYATEPEPALDHRRIACPRGKVLGGSSAINAMIYIRGNRRDFDHWHSLGNPGWGWDDILPYFRKSQQQARGASDYHGVDGPLAVTDQPAPHPFSLAFLDAAVELGYPLNPDFNGIDQEGAGLYQLTVKDGKRQSTAIAFLHSIRQRKNLHIVTHAEVSAVLFDRTRAIGVRYTHDGMDTQVLANREIIVSAGTINSPKLLLLSGIGPAEQLRRFGIPTVVDLPGVGQNLQDHPRLEVGYRSTKYIPLGDTSNGAEAGLFLLASFGQTDRAPDLQFHFVPVGEVVEISNGTSAEIHFTMNPSRPQSRGDVRLRSVNPAEPPIIQVNYLKHPADFALLVEGIAIARNLARTRALAHICGEEIAPGISIQDENDIRTYIRQSCDCIWHPVGTCKMGTDALAVVDPQLRVHGIEGLRVVDASIMPTITSGNTNAPTIMIGEKASDLIKGVQTI